MQTILYSSKRKCDACGALVCSNAPGISGFTKYYQCTLCYESSVPDFDNELKLNQDKISEEVRSTKRTVARRVSTKPVGFDLCLTCKARSSHLHPLTLVSDPKEC